MEINTICDALLGAAGEQDLGSYFPDTDEAFKDISSMKLLERIKGIISKKGYSILNIDTVVIAQEPKIGPFRDKMRENIREILNIGPDQVNVKAKTAERLGPIGEGKAIACEAVVLLE